MNYEMTLTDARQLKTVVDRKLVWTQSKQLSNSHCRRWHNTDSSVRSGGVNCISDNVRLSLTEKMETEHVQLGRHAAVKWAETHSKLPLRCVTDTAILCHWNVQEGHSACKNLSGGVLHGYLSAARCRLAYGPADATATHCLLLQ